MASAFSKLCILFFVLCQACGPITASTKITDAQDQVNRAAELEAPKYAPFEFQGAVLYLEKAREEEGYSYYQDAVTLAKTAFQLAIDAQRLAQQRKAEALAEAQKTESEEKETEAER